VAQIFQDERGIPHKGRAHFGKQALGLGLLHSFWRADVAAEEVAAIELSLPGLERGRELLNRPLRLGTPASGCAVRLGKVQAYYLDGTGDRATGFATSHPPGESGRNPDRLFVVQSVVRGKRGQNCLRARIALPHQLHRPFGFGHDGV